MSWSIPPAPGYTCLHHDYYFFINMFILLQFQAHHHTTEWETHDKLSCFIIICASCLTMDANRIPTDILSCDSVHCLSLLIVRPNMPTFQMLFLWMASCPLHLSSLERESLSTSKFCKCHGSHYLANRP